MNPLDVREGMDYGIFGWRDTEKIIYPSESEDLIFRKWEDTLEDEFKDTCAKNFLLKSIGEERPYQVCTDTGTRRPIGRNTINYFGG